MRLELSGSLIHPEPMVLKFIASQSFDTLSFIDLGYTHFEVICIGGGGGSGGGIDTANTGTLIKNFGGAGGGGGFQRVRGLLSALPDSCAIVIGAGGTAGANHASNPASTTNGNDGGASTFNATTCRASGGKGGKRAQSNSDTVTTQADGGDGGIGDRSIAGGGAIGGVAGTPSATGPGTAGTPGTDGTIANDIGKGGGGGAGGVAKYGSGGISCNLATAGGRGAYNPGDTSVYGPGLPPSNDSVTGAVNVVPGKASGAKAAPLNQLPTVYGQSGDPGVVVIRLTALVILTTPADPLPPVTNTQYGRVYRPMTFTKAVSGQVTSPAVGDAYGSDIYGMGIYIGAPQKYGISQKAFTFGKAVSGTGSTPAPKQTPVAEISLASHVAPAARINHKVIIRARTLTGSTGVIKAALYQGATNRSGDLTSVNLTNVLTDYELLISDAAAATITDYSNLSIRFWGYNPGSTGLVYQVANVKLQLPPT